MIGDFFFSIYFIIVFAFFFGGGRMIMYSLFLARLRYTLFSSSMYYSYEGFIVYSCFVVFHRIAFIVYIPGGAKRPCCFTAYTRKWSGKEEKEDIFRGVEYQEEKTVLKNRDREEI